MHIWMRRWTKPSNFLTCCSQHNRLGKSLISKATDSSTKDLPSTQKTMCAKLGACINNIHLWLPANGLELNDSMNFYSFRWKTWTIIHHPASTLTLTYPSANAKDLSIITDEDLSLSKHISAICKAAIFQLCRICDICQFLTMAATKTLVQSIILEL